MGKVDGMELPGRGGCHKFQGVQASRSSGSSGLTMSMGRLLHIIYSIGVGAQFAELCSDTYEIHIFL
jgi:hypothetical protein